MQICLERVRLLELEVEAMTALGACAKAVKEPTPETPFDEAAAEQVDRAFAAWHAIRDQIKEHEREHGCGPER